MSLGDSVYPGVGTCGWVKLGRLVVISGTGIVQLILQMNQKVVVPSFRKNIFTTSLNPHTRCVIKSIDKSVISNSN